MGTLKAASGAARFKISLGLTKEMKSAGFLYFNEKEIKDHSLTYPKRLKCAFVNGITYSLNGYSYITNIICPQGIVRLNPNNGSTNYFIDFYPLNGSQFFKRIRLSWPNVSYGESINDLNVTEMDGTGATKKEYTFHFSQTTSTWETKEKGSILNESIQELWTSYTNRTDTITITNAIGQIIRKRIEDKILYPWGIETVKSINGDDTTAITNLWSYYDNYSEMGYARVKQWTGPSGSWKKYFYDSIGRLTNEVTQFGNNTSTTLPGQNIESIKIYSTNGNYSEITKWLGYEVSRNEYIFSTNRVEMRVYDGNRILTNITERYDPVDWPVGNLKREIRPDGTMTLYFYSTNSVTNFVTTVLSGQPDASGTNIIWGTKTTTTRGPMGQVLSIVNRAIQSSGEIVVGFETNRCDFLGRSTNTVYQDGTWVNRTYESFGLKSETNPEGV